MPAVCIVDLEPDAAHWMHASRAAIPPGAVYRSLACGGGNGIDVILTRADNPTGTNIRIIYSAATKAELLVEGRTSFTNAVVNNTINPALVAHGLPPIPAGIRVKRDVAVFIAFPFADAVDPDLGDV